MILQIAGKLFWSQFILFVVARFWPGMSDENGRTTLRAIGSVGVILLATSSAPALDWPNRPVTMVVPFAAAGPSDVTGRILAQGLQEVLGQKIVVENVSGAGGTLGSLRVAKAEPDGYQFVLGNSGTHAWAQSLYKNPPYDAAADFTPVGLLNEGPRVIIVPRNFPANSLSEFIAYIRENQATIKYGSAGAGSASHISCVLLNAVLGINPTHVPYRGLGPALQDLIAGRIDYMCDAVVTSAPQIDINAVKAIASTGLTRAHRLPNVPTALEQNLDFYITGWQAIFLPKNAPDEIVRKFNWAINETLGLPVVRQQFETLGEEIVSEDRRTPEYLAHFLQSEIKKWSPLIKANIRSAD
jgi:tripartite-type tricarboxylate transporter receptor subunit TctC